MESRRTDKTDISAQRAQWSTGGSQWKRETSLRDLLLPVAFLMTAVVLLGLLRREAPETPESSSASHVHAEKAAPVAAERSNGPGLAVTPTVPSRHVGLGNRLLSLAHTGSGEATLKSARESLTLLLRIIPLPEPQRTNLLRVVESASPWKQKEHHYSFVEDRVVISTQATNIAFVRNSVILVDAPLNISHSENNIIIGGADVTISNEGSNGGSLVVSRGAARIAAAHSTVVYAVGGMRIAFPKDVSALNSRELGRRHKSIKFMDMAPIFGEEVND